jgi:CspA family cold shock protein
VAADPGRQDGPPRRARRGFGIISTDGGADVFVHYSQIDSSGFRSLDEGQRVEIGQGANGPQATGVRVMRLAGDGLDGELPWPAGSPGR